MPLTIGELKAWLQSLPAELDRIEIACETGEGWPRSIHNVSYYNGPSVTIYLGDFAHPFTPRDLARMPPQLRGAAERSIAAGQWKFTEVDRKDEGPAPLGHYSFNPPLSIPGEAYDPGG
jgi:hypothetical protein